MSPIVLVVLEAGDAAAERVLHALSEGGLGCQVRRVTARAGLAASLAAGRVEAVIAGAAVSTCGPAAVLEEVRAHAPDTPVVLVADGALADACDWLASGVAACVPADRLDKLAPAVRHAIAERDRRRAEGAAVRRRDELLSRVAHQMRTPQSALLGWAALLRGRRLDEAAKARALEAIERNARVQARMVEDLVDVSRMITGGLRLEVTEVEICPLVGAAVEAVRAAAEAAGVALAAEVDEAAGTVAGDPRRLDQIVRELLGNAVRVTPRGGRVDLQLAREGRRVRITVRDTGRGIGPDVLPHVFDGLRHIDRPAHHGLGVGLWRVRHLVQAHGGSVVAESAGEGQGATFTVTLPICPP